MCKKAPRILGNLLSAMNDIHMVFKTHSDVYEEIPYYSSYIDEERDFYKAWKCATIKYLNKTIGTRKFPSEMIFNLQVTAETQTEIFVEES